MNRYIPTEADRHSSFQFSKEYIEGREAYPDIGICQNPYPDNTKEAQDWEHGWDDAQGYDDYRSGI